LLDVDLDECSGQLLVFPRRRRFARPKSDDHILPADRLPGVERHVLDDAIPLVEDAEHRNPLAHRRYAGRVGAQRHGRIGDDRLGRIFLGSLAASSNKGERDQERDSGSLHAYSGIQGS